MRKIIHVKPLPIKGITTTQDLYKLADRLGVHVDKIVVEDQAKDLPEQGSFIILLVAPHSSSGHWCARFNDEYFDPTGCPAPLTIPHVKTFNKIQYQGTYADCCGDWCVLWLYSKQKKKDLFKSFYEIDKWN